MKQRVRRQGILERECTLGGLLSKGAVGACVKGSGEMGTCVVWRLQIYEHSARYKSNETSLLRTMSCPEIAW